MGALTLSHEPDPARRDLSRFVRKEADGSVTFEAAVGGARCANCIAKIEAGVGALEGVRQARLNLSTGKLTVVFRGNADPAGVLGRVRALGYQAQPFEAEAAEEDENEEGRFLLRCLAVAGFGTVFVVGLTDAVWYGGDDMNEATRNLFFWIAAFVSVPVTLYASQPFFRSAWRVLSAGQTNMDVPIGLAIVLSLGLSLFQTVTHQQHSYFDAAVMLAFLLLIGRYLDFLLRARAHGAARRLIAMQNTLAQRLKPDGSLETVAARVLMPNDRILLASGERVPADGTVESETEADLSLVTGETAPVTIAPGTILRSGSLVIGRSTILRVSARVQDSLLADLARLLDAGQQTKGRYVRLADKVAKAYVPFVTGAALLVFAVWILGGAAFTTAITNAITVLIITCPCALGLAVPAVQIVATGRLFERGVLVKSGDALERLAHADTAVFDKTGTLTFGEPELQNASEIPVRVLREAAELARASRHPFARALARAAGDGPVATGVAERAGCGLEVHRHAKTYRLGSAAWCGAPAASHGSELWYRAGEEPPVRFAFHDRPRPDLKHMVSALEQRNMTVEMLTGDAEGPAAELAHAAGIAVWRSRIDPKQKAAHLEELRKRGRRVLMVGDGLNDAGALALADVSMAPGSAADVSQLAADFILRTDRLMPVAETIDIARKAQRLVHQNFAFAAVYNLAAVPVAMLGLVSPLLAAALMAASSLAVTLNALRLSWSRIA